MSAPLATAAFSLAVVSAFGDWLAVARRARHLEYICKPATLACLLVAGLFITAGPHDVWAAPYFLIALAASLIGDVCLMLPANRFFLAGLFAFLVAHIAYITGLNPTPPPAISFLLLVPIALLVAFLLRSVARGLRAGGKTKLLLPVIAYGLAIGLMLFSAWAALFRAEGSAFRRVTVIVGASLFFVSDALLAWDRFVRPSRSAALRVIVTYHLAQFALTASLAVAA